MTSLFLGNVSFTLLFPFPTAAAFSISAVGTLYSQNQALLTLTTLAILLGFYSITFYQKYQ